MLVKSSRAVSNTQVREAWRNDVCLCQLIGEYREWSKLTIDEQIDRISEDMLVKCDIMPKVNMVVLRAAEVYRDVTGRSPRTVGNEVSARLQLGENPFIALVTNLLKEEGLKPPSPYAITKMLRKKPIKRVVRARNV